MATTTKGNIIIERRFADKPQAERRKAVKRFQNGDSLGGIAKDLKLSATKARYLVYQQMVEDGDVARIEPTAEAIRKARSAKDAPDWHWLACRTGLSTSKVQRLAESS